MGLYCRLVLVMNIGMYDLVILCLVHPLLEFNELRFCIIKRHKGHKNTHVYIEIYGMACSSCTIGYQLSHLEFLRVPGSSSCV